MGKKLTFINHELLLEQGIARFFYKLEANGQEHDFVETISFPKENIDIQDQKLVNSILDCLLLVLGISYWKLYCPKEIKLEPIEITIDQSKFWNTLYTKGLGEFFYKNKIDFRGLVNFPYSKSTINHEPSTINHKNRSLLMFGGGKDSIVSAELLKKAKKDFTLFMVNTSSVQDQTAKLVGKNQIVFKRTLDPKLFELNKMPETYNGHIPVTAIWEFLGLFACSLYNYSNVIASNEYSSNYGNVSYLGSEINHQWSKSYEFSILLQEYSKKYLTEKIIPFSLLRPWHEIKIVQEFAKYPQYFPYFSSCNTNFMIKNSRLKIKDSRPWCGKCAKCLFVFIMLSAFLKKDELIKIFGKNLLGDPELLPILKDLTGVENIKPFECVGTPEETQIALYKAYKTGNYNLDKLMKYFVKAILPTMNDIEGKSKFLLIDKKPCSIPKDFLIV